MNFEQLRPRFVRHLAGFGPSSGNIWSTPHLPLDRSRFPVPELLLLLLRDVMGYSWADRGEKIRWSVYFSVGADDFSIELAKFGLRLCYLPEGEGKIPRVIGQLESALGRLEKLLAPYADTQIAAGNVTIANRSSVFRARYEFFRAKADVAYRASSRTPARPKKPKWGARAELASVFEHVGSRIAKEREGFFLSVAMVDAYFSYLEHQLVLLRAFMGTALGDMTVADILAARWDEKLRLVMGEARGDHATLVGEMRQLKERIRNPFAHGGVENDLGSVFFHIPGVGAIPGNMSRTRTSAHFKWIPVEAPDHERVCRLFDELDEMLKSGRLKKPARILEAGVDPAWDTASLAKYRKLNRKSRAGLEEWLEHWNYEWARHANMDY